MRTMIHENCDFTLEEIDKFLHSRKIPYEATLDQVLEYWGKKKWLTTNGEKVATVSAAVNVVNSFVIQQKRKTGVVDFDKVYQKKNEESEWVNKKDPYYNQLSMDQWKAYREFIFAVRGKSAKCVESLTNLISTTKNILRIDLLGNTCQMKLWFYVAIAIDTSIRLKLIKDMNIGLIAVDSDYPNLALMKISAWHKGQGDSVEWYNPFDEYDIVYMSKIFSFTPDYGQWITNTKQIRKGGTGYDLYSVLPEEMEFVTPDYSLYPSIDNKTAYGFLTRGCPNKCKWCVVPRKEGPVRQYMDVDDVAVDGRTNLILMDNNVLACDYGLQQIEKIIERGYRVDFNQALDARLVTDDIAKLLAKVRWLDVIRFGCDTPKQIQECEEAMKMIDSYRKNPATYLMYTMIGDDFDEVLKRLSYWRSFKRVRVVAQPFRDVDNPHQIVPQWQKDMARWAMRREIYTTCEFKDYEPRKGFKCSEYFN